MKYEKPIVIIYDEEVLLEIEALAQSICNCAAQGARVCSATKKVK